MGDDVADAVGGMLVDGRMEAWRGNLLEVIGAGGKFEELDQQRHAPEAVGLGHLMQERGGLLAGRPFEFEAEARAFEQTADSRHGRVLGPLFAEEVRAELDEDPLHASLASFAVVTEVVREVGAEEQNLACLERRHLVADPAFRTAAQQEENLMLGVVMPDAPEVALAQVLTRDQLVGRDGRLLFLDETHA